MVQCCEIEKSFCLFWNVFHFVYLVLHYFLCVDKKLKFQGRNKTQNINVKGRKSLLEQDGKRSINMRIKVIEYNRD